MTTLRDVAELAGVSIATVSRVLNSDTTLVVSNSTRKKVFKAADQLNYTKYKQNLVSVGATFFLVTQFDEKEELENLYYFSIILGIEKRCKEMNINLKRVSIEQLQNKEIDGIIALGYFYEEDIKRLDDFSERLIFVDFESEGFNSLLVDYGQAIKEIVRYLEMKKITNIYLLTENKFEKNSIVDEKRTKLEHEIKKRKNLKIVNYLSCESSEMAAFNVITEFFSTNDLIKNSVLFATTDTLAVGAMRSLQEIGYIISDEIRVIGFNDLSIAKYIYPSLTTVRVYSEWMGKVAVSTLIDVVNNQPPVTKKIMVSTELISRRSC